VDHLARLAAAADLLLAKVAAPSARWQLLMARDAALTELQSSWRSPRTLLAGGPTSLTLDGVGSLRRRRAYERPADRYDYGDDGFEAEALNAALGDILWR
jgi:hypothetical protein